MKIWWNWNISILFEKVVDIQTTLNTNQTLSSVPIALFVLFPDSVGENNVRRLLNVKAILQLLP